MTRYSSLVEDLPNIWGVGSEGAAFDLMTSRTRLRNNSTRPLLLAFIRGRQFCPRGCASAGDPLH